MPAWQLLQSTATSSQLPPGRSVTAAGRHPGVWLWCAGLRQRVMLQLQTSCRPSWLHLPCPASPQSAQHLPGQQACKQWQQLQLVSTCPAAPKAQVRDMPLMVTTGEHRPSLSCRPAANSWKCQGRTWQRACARAAWHPLQRSVQLRRLPWQSSCPCRAEPAWRGSRCGEQPPAAQGTHTAHSSAAGNLQSAFGSPCLPSGSLGQGSLANRAHGPFAKLE